MPRRAARSADGDEWSEWTRAGHHTSQRVQGSPESMLARVNRCVGLLDEVDNRACQSCHAVADRSAGQHSGVRGLAFEGLRA